MVLYYIRIRRSHLKSESFEGGAYWWRDHIWPIRNELVSWRHIFSFQLKKEQSYSLVFSYLFALLYIYFYPVMRVSQQVSLGAYQLVPSFLATLALTIWKKNSIKKNSKKFLGTRKDFCKMSFSSSPKITWKRDAQFYEILF